jgi:D-alanyl-D-alanine-carboxypeptidase/D-alanyl-D-alanine-endopeptidase
MLSRFLCCIAVFLTWLAPVRAAEPMPSRYVPALERMFEASRAPGMVAAVIDGDRVHVKGFGRTSATNTATPDANTLLRLNSLSKLMAGEVLARMVSTGGISLDATLQQRAPAGRRVPMHRNARPIFIRDLLVHTSGIPRDLPVSLWSAPASLKSARWDWLGGTHLRNPPGRVAEYSNAGWIFLGDAMEHAAQRSYPSMLQDHLASMIGPGGMTLAPTPAQCAHLLAAQAPSCDQGHATAPSWGLYASTADVGLWMQRLMAARPGTALHLSLQPVVQRSSLGAVRTLDFAGRAEALGWGWVFIRVGDHMVLQKTGGGVRTMNYIILSPEKRRALFVTVSRMDIEMLRRLTRDANRIMGQILADAE